MSRLNPARRAKAKARAAKRDTFNAEQSMLQCGKVRSGLAKFNFSGSLRGPRMSAEPNDSMKPTGFVLPANGRSNLIVPAKPDAFIPDVSLGYTVAASEPENLDRKRRVLRMCRKAFRRTRG
jgi:hypothetical protein